MTKKTVGRKKSRRAKKQISNPMTASWEELAQTIPKKDWYAFRDLVLCADIAGELRPISLVEKFPAHPIVLLVQRFLETGNRRAINKALKAVAGTDDRHLLLLMKS